MDMATSHILAKLDHIEREIGELRRDLTNGLAKTSSISKKAKLSFRVKSMPPFLQSLMAGGLIWTVGISSKAFLDNGGDPAWLISALLKFAFGLFFGAG